MKNAMWKKIIATLMLAAAAPSFAQLTYNGCPNVVPADFAMVPLVTNATDATTQEPLKMAVGTDALGNVDVYFVQRAGRLRKYVGATRTTVTLANFALTLTAARSEGMVGIALDPAFTTNGWIFLYFGMGTTWWVSRFTLTGNTLNLASEKVIFRFTTNAIAQHVAGALKFDWAGNLFISSADNDGATTPAGPDLTNPYLAANTNSYNGKILRIHPIAFPDNQTPAPGVGTTYTIPTGNLFAPGTALTLPEIYVMGTRNPFTIAIDSVRRGLVWGDVGPDVFPTGSTNPAEWSEEHDFTTTPGNFGWPFWAGNQIQLQAGYGTPAAPVNNRADNTGIVNLPPARAAISPYGKNCAITGPVYYYNGASTSTIKFPPHFDGAWIVGDFNTEWIDGIQLNPTGTAITARQRFGTTANLANLNALTDLNMGTDGALYVINYAGYRTTSAATGLYRVEYRGTCRPSTPILPDLRAGARNLLELRGLEVSVLTSGNHSLEVRDLQGKTVAFRQGKGQARYSFSDLKTPGVYLLNFSSAEGKAARKLVKD